MPSFPVARTTGGAASAPVGVRHFAPALLAVVLAAGVGAVPLVCTGQELAPTQGMALEGSLTTLVQGARRGTLAGPEAQRSRANVRADLAATLPAGQWGHSSGSLYLHARLGQGQGLALPPTYTASANSTVFTTNASDPQGLQAALVQARYQWTVPLGSDAGSADAAAAHQATFTVGKIDPFAFFDQNSVADDETRHFANNAFVHNPLLDSGGDIGVGRDGAAPGVVAAYDNARDAAHPWGAALAVFAAGSGSGGGKPLVLAQAWTTLQLNALPGTYRVYAWRNARAHDADGRAARHSGWGLSIDQRVAAQLTLFARWGRQGAGKVRFDRALTLGGELGGAAWGRSSDALGLALGTLRGTDGSDGGTRSVERIAELYYRLHLGGPVEITPSVQRIARPGGQGSAPSVVLAGLRARVGF